ncbi:MAG: hypothetical protein WAO88_09635, partial [Roseicyclus sp.]|uniref:hypothetical protein n=1 Tax=Roseicyclus sp. TaxID=1914329 RepID=UPI003BB038EB
MLAALPCFIAAFPGGTRQAPASACYNLLEFGKTREKFGGERSDVTVSEDSTLPAQGAPWTPGGRKPGEGRETLAQKDASFDVPQSVPALLARNVA